MSTRKKEGGSVREKRGTSPSPLGTTLRKKSPNSTKTVSRSLDSSPSGKSIPNYLKPTLSSSGDATKIQGRKPVSNTDSAIKPNLARRRSFDKPPSPTRTLKTRGVSPTPTFRSSSFSSKTTTTSPKGDRTSRGTRDSAGKQHSLYARPVGTAKKSSTLGKKGETKTTSSRKEPKLNNHTIKDVDQEKEHEDSPQAGQEEVDEDTITKQLEAEIQKVDSPTFLEEDDAEIAKAESPTTLEESDASTTLKAESPTNIEQGDANEGDIVSDHDEEMENESCIEEQEMQEDNANEMDDTNPDESAKEEAEDKERDDEEEEAVSEVDAGEVQEGEDAAPKLAHGKKDLALSNNVIEETANKLQKQSSRVRALAGAFETVISLQEPK